MYAKIVDEETKKVIVGIGTDSDYYKSIGMEDMEVEQGSDGNWYVKGHAPKKTLDELKAEKTKEISETFEKLQSYNCTECYVTSSLGFQINADACSATNIEALIDMLPDDTTTTLFKLYDNTFRALNRPQLKTMLMECKKNGLALYQQKFALLKAVSTAATADEVNAINVAFTMSDYSTSAS